MEALPMATQDPTTSICLPAMTEVERQAREYDSLNSGSRVLCLVIHIVLTSHEKERCETQ